MEAKQKIISHVKGTIIFCPSCGDHMATLVEDIYNDGTILPQALAPHEGQGPWVYGEPFLCRKCGAPWQIGVVPSTLENTILISRAELEHIQSWAQFNIGKCARQSVVIAECLDKLYAGIAYGLTPREQDVYNDLRIHFNAEIEMIKKYKDQMLGNKN